MAARVAVVGAGYAGCAAAVTLAAAGAEVTLFESARSLGGRARRVEFAPGDATGFPTLDNGQHILIGAYQSLLALMRQVGVDPSTALERRALELHVLPDFHLRAPFRGRLGVALGLATARGLDWDDRRRAARLMLALRRTNYRLAADQPVADWLAALEQSPRLCRYLWEPLCVAALNTPIQSASAQLFANVLRDSVDGPRGASDLLLPRFDLSALFPDPAARFVAARGGRVLVGLSVRALSINASEWRIDDRGERFDAVVLATSPTAALRLLAPFPAAIAVREQIAALDYQPIYTVYLRFAESARLPHSMIGIAGTLVQWAFDRGRLSGPPGLVAAVISARGAHEALSLELLGEAVAAELRAHFPQLPPPSAIRTIAERRATFSARPMLARPPNATGMDRLFLAGDYIASDYPGTLESAVRSGQAAARMALDALDH